MFAVGGILIILSLAAPGTSFSCQETYGPEWFCLAAGNGDKGCYYFGTEDLTFPQAKADCEARGSIPVVIETEEENQALLEFLEGHGGGHHWIGLIINHDTDEFIWIDAPDVPPNYLNWAPGEPHTDHVGEYCTQIFYDTGEWNDVPCDKTIRHICEKPFNCGLFSNSTDWMQMNTSVSHSCYYFCDKRMNFTKAERQCTMRDGRMASIESGQENAMILEYVRNSRKNRWINAGIDHDVDPALVFWRHLPNDDMPYENFEEGEVNNHNGNEECVRFNRKTGTWHDIPCWKALKCICELPLTC